jgi:O-antigen ligase
VAALALVVVVLAALAALPGVAERLRTIGSMRDDTTRDRLAMLSTGLALVRQHPVTGIGPGQVKRVYPIAAGPDALRHSTSHLHNTPLQIAVERGLPGLAAWLAIFVVFLSHTVRFVRGRPRGLAHEPRSTHEDISHALAPRARADHGRRRRTHRRRPLLHRERRRAEALRRP